MLTPLEKHMTPFGFQRRILGLTRDNIALGKSNVRLMRQTEVAEREALHANEYAQGLRTELEAIYDKELSPIVNLVEQHSELSVDTFRIHDMRFDRQCIRAQLVIDEVYFQMLSEPHANTQLREDVAHQLADGLAGKLKEHIVEVLRSHS